MVYWYIPVILAILLLLYLIPKYKLPQKLARFIQGMFNKKSVASAPPVSSGKGDAGFAAKIDILSSAKKK